MSGEAEEIKRLVSYVRSLPRLDALAPWGRASEGYDHIGAKLADATLQRGTNYETGVRKRVVRIANEFPGAASTSGLLGLLRLRTAEEILQLSGGAKPATFSSLAQMLHDESVETVDELRVFLSDRWRANRLRRISGVGAKTVSFLKLVVGLDAVAVDMHILAALDAAQVPPCDPSEVETLFAGAAAELSMPMRDIDSLLWRHHSQASAKGRGK